SVRQATGRPGAPAVDRRPCSRSKAVAPRGRLLFRVRMHLRRRRIVRWLRDPGQALGAAGEWPRREVAVVVDRIPAGLDATHLGSVVIDEMRNGHGGAPACWWFDTNDSL